MMRKIVLIILFSFISPMLTAQICSNNLPATTPNNRFTIHNDGTVTDNRTGLMWKRCLEGESGAFCETGSTTFTWKQALVHANGFSFANYQDWRLPNIKETYSIVERTCFYPAMNLTIFPHRESGAYWIWTSSTDAADGSKAWITSSDAGVSATHNKNNAYYIRLVRDGFKIF